MDKQPYWIRFANLGMIRLNQPAGDGGAGNDGDGDTDEDDAETDPDAKDAAPEGAGDAAGDGDEETEPPATLEEALERLQKAEADRVALARVRRDLDRRSKKDARRIKELETASSAKGKGEGDTKEDFDPDAERDRIRAELAVENGHERARLKAEALLTGKVSISPARAVVLLGDEYKEAVGDDGTVDEKELADMVKSLLEDNPGLKVARGDGAFQGQADGGVREAHRVSEEQQIQDEIEKATKDKNFERVISLKQRLAAIQKTKKKG